MINVRKRHGRHAQPLVKIRRLLRERHLDEFDRGRILTHELPKEGFGCLAGFAPGCEESHYDEFMFFVDDVVFVGGEGVDGLDGEGFVSLVPLEEFGYESSDYLFPFSVLVVLLLVGDFFVVSFFFHGKHGRLD